MESESLIFTGLEIPRDYDFQSGVRNFPHLPLIICYYVYEKRFFLGYVFVVNNIIPFFEVTSLFIGSYHFSTYKKLMIWCLFLLTSIEMFGIIHVAMCNRACRNKLKHGELSEWSKVQHSKCCVRNVPRVRIPNSPPK